MKGLNILAAFIGGAAIGAALGILFAPEKGEDTRQKIKDILREKGIKLNRSEMVDERFTSVLAHQAMLDGGLKKKARQDKALVDEISATIILQSYLESKKYQF